MFLLSFVYNVNTVTSVNEIFCLIKIVMFGGGDGLFDNNYRVTPGQVFSFENLNMNVEIDLDHDEQISKM